MSATPTLLMRGFVEVNEPRIEILGTTFEMSSVFIVCGVIILPFILAVIARRQIALAMTAWAVFVFILALSDARLSADLSTLTPIKLRWELIGQITLWSAPAIFAGYFVAMALEKRLARKL